MVPVNLLSAINVSTLATVVTSVVRPRAWHSFSYCCYYDPLVAAAAVVVDNDEDDQLGLKRSPTPSSYTPKTRTPSAQ
jgi:hypothetical protein